MAKSPRGFRAALLIGWVALSAAGLLYARAKNIPGWAALPVVAAFLFEYPFYLLTGFPQIRERLSGPKLPAILVALNLVPYLLCCLGAVTFHWTDLARLAALAIVLGCWYRVFPAKPLADAGFLAVVVAASLGRYFDPIYATPVRLYAAELGRVGLFITAALALMLQRRILETGYGFIPSGKDWRIGVVHYLYFMAIGLPIALAVKAVHFGKPAPVWLAAATFIGFLWGLALAEEFLFRGVLQQWLEDWTTSRTAALLLASLLFGAAHLLYRGAFPNWGMALLGGLNGWFCGRARNQAGSIRAGVVTHTLVVTTWRAFLA
jgi:membrane protease YdiL (CAAX protease family)